MHRFALLLGVALSLVTTSAAAQNGDGFADVLASSPFSAPRPMGAWTG
jgi:hypothetical protein